MQERRRIVERAVRVACVVVALALVAAVARPACGADDTGPPASPSAAPTPERAAPMAPVEASEQPLASWATRIGTLQYTPGRGFGVGDTGLTLGGYANLSLIRNEGGKAELGLDDVSLFVIFDPLPRLRFFSELEYADAFVVDADGHVDSPDEATVERLFLDFDFSDALRLRTGIFLTPVGRWNVIHAAPLVWTTSRPLTTVLPFDPNVTGVMLFGSWFPEVGTISYSLFDQFAGPIEGNPTFHPADHSDGARLQYDNDAGWSVGGSFVISRRDGDWRQLAGLDALWSRRPVEVMAEAVVDAGFGDAPQWGVYVQPVLAVSDRLSLVTRYEHYAPQGNTPQVNIMTAGLAFRLFPTVVLKTEYQVVDRRSDVAPAGFRASMAILF